MTEAPPLPSVTAADVCDPTATTPTAAHPHAPTLAPVPSPVAIPALSTSPAPAQGPAIGDMLRDGVTHALQVVGTAAYFEQLARTDKKLFKEYVALALAAAGIGPKAAKSGGVHAQHTIINVLSAIPRSALDALPEGYQIGG